MKEITSYDSNGVPIAYLEDDKFIYLFSGRPAAYLIYDSVYSYTGEHLGRYDAGIIRDNCGSIVLVTEEATDSPIHPLQQVKPEKLAKRPRPLKGFRQMPPPKPMDRPTWSNISAYQFFGEHYGPS